MAGKIVHQFSHKSPSLFEFYGNFGKDHIAFRVQMRVRATGVSIFTMIDTMMMDKFSGNGARA